METPLYNNQNHNNNSSHNRYPRSYHGGRRNDGGYRGGNRGGHRGGYGGGHRGGYRGGRGGYSRPPNSNPHNPSDNSAYNRLDVKQSLVDYIYRSVDLSKYRYKIMTVESDLKLLNNSDKTYYVSPNYNGVNSLMVFTKLQGMYYSFVVDRRTIPYNQRHLDLNKVRLIPVSVRLDESIYRGTILDGVTLYNSHTPEKGVRNKAPQDSTKVFVINDVYRLRGSDISEDLINYKMMNLNAYLKSCYVEDKHLSSVNLVVNVLYQLKDIKPLIHNFIIKSKYKSSIKGVCFYPDTSGTKLVYLYTNCSDSITDSTTESNRSPVVVRQSNIKLDLDKDKAAITAIFRMDGTDTVDVYNLCLYKEVVKNGKRYGKYKKYAIAYVPTTQCSYFCKDVMHTSDTNSVLVKCTYLPDKQKWIPTEPAPKGCKLSDNLSQVDKLVQ